MSSPNGPMYLHDYTSIMLDSICANCKCNTISLFIVSSNCTTMGIRGHKSSRFQDTHMEFSNFCSSKWLWLSKWVYIINSPKAFGEFIGSLSQFWGQLFPLLDTEFPLFFSLVFSILSFSKFYSPLNFFSFFFCLFLSFSLSFSLTFSLAFSCAFSLSFIFSYLVQRSYK